MHERNKSILDFASFLSVLQLYPTTNAPLLSPFPLRLNITIIKKKIDNLSKHFVTKFLANLQADLPLLMFVRGNFALSMNLSENNTDSLEGQRVSMG